jgi:hypothetical protein
MNTLVTKKKIGKCPRISSNESVSSHVELSCFQQIEADALESIEHRMGHHSWTQAFSDKSQDSKETAQCEDDHHPPRTLVAVSQAKDDCLKHQPQVDVSEKRSKLLLEISTENDFFNDSRESA